MAGLRVGSKKKKETKKKKKKKKKRERERGELSKNASVNAATAQDTLHKQHSSGTSYRRWLRPRW